MLDTFLKSLVDVWGGNGDICGIKSVKKMEVEVVKFKVAKFLEIALYYTYLL